MPVIEKTLIDFINSSVGREDQVEASTDLLHENLLDSLMLMELVLLIENNWGVQLQGDDIAPSHFRTVQNLAILIQTRIESPGNQRLAA